MVRNNVVSACVSLASLRSISFALLEFRYGQKMHVELKKINSHLYRETSFPFEALEMVIWHACYDKILINIYIYISFYIYT